MKLKVSFSTISQYMACFALILECSSIYINQAQVAFPSGNEILVVGFIPLLVQALVAFITRPSFGKQALAQILLFYVYCTGYALTLGRQELVNFSMKFLVIFPIIYLCVIYLFLSVRIIPFLNRFIRTVTVVAVVSLVVWIAGPVSGFIQPTGSLTFLWGDLVQTTPSYFFIQFAPQVEQTFIGLTRNTSFFTEAPKYCLILVIALCFDWTFFRNRSREILLFGTILTTFSFTGIVAFLILIFVEYSVRVLRELSSGKATGRVLILLTIVTVGLSVTSFLLQAKLSTSSGVGRVGDFQVSYFVGRQHPVFGFGFLNNDYLNRVLHAVRLASGVGNTMGLSNSFSQVFIDGGIYLLFIYIFALASVLVTGLRRGSGSVTALGCVFLFLFFTTYFSYSGVMFFLLSIGLCIFHTRAESLLRHGKPLSGAELYNQ